MPSSYCQSGGRSQCTDCNGLWCEGTVAPPRPSAPPSPPRPPFSPTRAGCYLPQCGCPPYLSGEAWCANTNDHDPHVNAAYFIEPLCQDGLEATCVSCAGVWCEGYTAPPYPPFSPVPPMPPPHPPSLPMPPASPMPPAHPPLDGWFGGCYSRECGCPWTPARHAPSWCTERSASGPNAAEGGTLKSFWEDQSYCGRNAGRCVGECGGVYCQGPAVPSPPPAPPAAPPVPSTGTEPGTWPWLPGYATRYWDCCKPSCSWLGSVPSFLPAARSCDSVGSTLPSPQPGSVEAVSACEPGGTAHACLDHAPFVATRDDASNRTAYAFAATPGFDPRRTCGTCFELRFTGFARAGSRLVHDVGAAQLNFSRSGKRLIVQATNIGYDVAPGQFDLMIPGGGVGLFDACSVQWRVEAGQVPLLGRQYGGLLSQCLETEPLSVTDASHRKACVRRHCHALYGAVPRLASALAGCLWSVDWLEAADNPEHLWRPVECPAALIALSGFGRPASLYLQNASTPPPGPPAPARAQPTTSTVPEATEALTNPLTLSGALTVGLLFGATALLAWHLRKHGRLAGLRPLGRYTQTLHIPRRPRPRFERLAEVHGTLEHGSDESAQQAALALGTFSEAAAEAERLSPKEDTDAQPQHGDAPPARWEPDEEINMT